MGSAPGGGSREWDAGTYDRVSTPQLEWAGPVLDRLELRGDETVLDAGCGSGRVTELLVERLPRGRVIAVDGSAAMVDATRRRLGDRVEVIHSDLLTLSLDEPVDAVFSNATFHWILDHDLLFSRIAAWLGPGGRLEAQCGGAGNIAAFEALIQRVASHSPWAREAATLAETRLFADAAATAERLRSAGFERIRCDTWTAPTRPPEPRAFIASVCLGPLLERIPADAHDGLLDSVMEIWDGRLDYVRLDISALRS